jgi:phenylalanyl-tRNA synthetase beta chain
MKLSEQWLREWINPALNTQQLADQLTMAGLEIESITPVAGEFTNVVIGHVLQAEQHPNADRLRVCQVDVGQTEKLTIVCGAANVRKDLKVAVAMIGAKLPGDFVIRESKLRGVSSFGMICSAEELGMEATASGIMELAADAPIGKDFRDWLQLNDQVFDVHVTPNRGDCLSVQGLAREIAVLNNGTLTLPVIKKIEPTISKNKKINSIRLAAPEACPLYIGREIHNINKNAQTPLWMIERLRRSGIRSVHPVVDVTNYVLLELGQPLHAFDVAKLDGVMQVRFAKSNEKLILLNEQEVKLNDKTLVIADQTQALAMAGVMGGLFSSITEHTTDIFLESAFFNPVVVAGRARQYGLSTDGAQRFERGVDPQLAQRAIERATELLLEIAGGQAGPVVEACDKDHLPKPAVIKLRKQRIERILGVVIPEATIIKILQSLGMQVAAQSDGVWNVIAPSYRFDISLEEDLIEELARIYGYHNIPAKQAQTSLTFLPQSEHHNKLAHLRHVLIERDYSEAVTYSFTAPRLQRLLDPQQTAIALSNPISADLSVMRTTLWPGLLQAVAYNQNRQQQRVRLFETGLRFIQQNEKILQEPVLAAAISGSLHPEQWGAAKRAVDFFDIKNDLEALFATTNNAAEFTWQKSEHPALHPGQTAAILFQNKPVGYLGALHPMLLEQLELLGPVYLFELPLSVLQQVQLPQHQAISKFPAMRRDISFWINADIPVQNILQTARVSAGEWLNDLVLFDVYQGKGAEANRRSLALGLVWQHPDRTLIDTEVNEWFATVVAKLKQNFALELRE